MKQLFLLSLLIIAVALISCGPKMTCPAYQSAFLLSDEVQDEYFSYFKKDSLPKDFTTSKKNVSGISQGPTVKTYNKRHYTFPMVHVYQVQETGDSLFGGTSATNIDNLDYDDLQDDDAKPAN